MVYVYRPAKEGLLQRRLTADDFLEGNGILPGFKIKVSEILEDIEG